MISQDFAPHKRKSMRSGINNISLARWASSPSATSWNRVLKLKSAIPLRRYSVQGSMRLVVAAKAASVRGSR